MYLFYKISILWYDTGNNPNGRPHPHTRYFWILRVAKFRLMEVNSTLLYIYKFPLKDTASLYIQIN